MGFDAACVGNVRILTSRTVVRPAEPLRADAERVHFLVELDAKFLELVRGTALEQLVHVDRVHQRFLREDHRLVGGAADADAEHPGRAPAGAHFGHGLEHPVHDRIRGIQHREHRLVLGAAALRGDRDFDGVSRDELDVHDGRRVVAGVLPREEGIRDDRRPEAILREPVSAAHALVHHLLQRSVVSQRAPMPAFTNTLTMPVSWQIGRRPSAHIREFVRICAIASFAAGDCSRA